MMNFVPKVASYLEILANITGVLLVKTEQNLPCLPEPPCLRRGWSLLMPKTPRPEWARSFFVMVRNQSTIRFFSVSLSNIWTSSPGKVKLMVVP